ncbi:hypothetical protein CASFOL_017089 [Castilleja foliolosa]|uniref:Uncharacterized protein n=1 Tax=Castilleja foliolosa TaxID=1961234 RepID=A0ABD3DEE1_9LAMI
MAERAEEELRQTPLSSSRCLTQYHSICVPVTDRF